MKQSKILKILLIMLGAIAILGAGELFYKSNTTPPSPTDITPIPRQNIEAEGVTKSVSNSEESPLLAYVLETKNNSYKIDENSMSFELAQIIGTAIRVKLKGYIDSQSYVPAYKKFIPVLYVESMEILQAPEGFKLMPSPTPETPN